jgi:purine-binding chemotaxis protein CheW
MGFYTHGSGAGLAGQPASFSKRMNSFSRLVVFQVEDGRYGVRFEDVERVVAAVELVPLPDAPDLVLGVFNLQGNVVPAIDTRLRLRLPSRELRVSDQFLVVRAAGRVLALVTDRVQGIVEAAALEVTATDHVVPGLPGVEGVLRLPDGVVVIHDLARFLSAEDGLRLDAARRRLASV